jgi:hypothetical protein
VHLVSLIVISLLARGQIPVATDTVPVTSQGATIVGVVTDSLGHALAGANVAVDGIPLAPTDGFGSFVIGVTANRTHVIQVRALGFLPGEFSLTAAPGATRTADIPLTSIAALLPGVKIVVHEDDPEKFSAGIGGFEHRRETLGGSFVNEEELKQRGYPPLSNLLGTMPGVTVQTTHNEGMSQAHVSMRGVPTIGGDCAIQIFLDGHPASLVDGNIDHLIGTHELAAIEVYPSSAWVPAQFIGPTSACGTIVLWTADGLVHPH